MLDSALHLVVIALVFTDYQKSGREGHLLLLSNNKANKVQKGFFL